MLRSHTSSMRFVHKILIHLVLLLMALKIKCFAITIDFYISLDSSKIPY